MRIRACALALLVLAAPTDLYVSSAVAQGAANDAFTEMARKRFQEGVRLYDQGKFEEARASFLQAYALKKHPAVLLNLAQSELRSDHSVEAARHFSEFLRDNPDADSAERKAAQDGLAVARTKTGQLEVSVDVDGADIFVDGELVGRSPLPEAIDVTPGTRRVEARSAGQNAQTQEIEAELGKVTKVALSIHATATPDEPEAAGEQGGSYAVSTEGRQPFVEWFAEDKVAWATGGAAVVGLGMGIIFTLAARTASNNADKIAGQIKVVAEHDPELKVYEGYNRTSNPCADPIPITSGVDYTPACGQLEKNFDARDTDKSLAVFGFILAGAGAAGTGVLYFLRTEPAEGDTTAGPTTARPTTATMIAPVIAPNVRGLAIGGTF